ncbi:hypothetical protein P3L10_011208 [Capsicum annuum]
MAHMVGQVFEAYRILFHDDELPPEGRAHNWLLHVTLQYKGNRISRVLIDLGSGLNILPLNTLTKLEIDMSKVQMWKMNMKGFDGSQRGTIGEITLDMMTGPVPFSIPFQVLDIPASYNLLLGRPWIHMNGAVPSTQHRSVRFEYFQQEVLIWGEGGQGGLDTLQWIGNIEEDIISCMQLERPLNAWSYMRWFGYEEYRGLGARLQGIIDPLVVDEKEHDCGLGYEGKNTSDPALSLYQIFISIGFRENDDIIKITEIIKRLTLTKDIIFFYEDLDNIETEEGHMIKDYIVGVDITWMNIGGKMMKGYEPGKGLGAKL